MTSSDDNYEDVRASNDESECEDESKQHPRQDRGCDPMDTEDDVTVSKEDVQQLLVMASILKSEMPEMNDRIRRLEGVVGLLVALMVLASFA